MKKFFCLILCLIMLTALTSTVSYAATHIDEIQPDSDVTYIIGVTNQDTPIIGTIPHYDAGEGTTVVVNPFQRTQTYGQGTNPITGNTYNVYNNTITPTYQESTTLNNNNTQTTTDTTAQTSTEQPKEEEKKDEAKLSLENQAIEFKIETKPEPTPEPTPAPAIEESKPGFFKRIGNFFKKLFGHEEPEVIEVTTVDTTTENTTSTENTNEIIIEQKPFELNLDTPYGKTIQEIFTLTNTARVAENLTPLTYNIDWQAAADTRAQEISKKFSHTRPDGTTCFTVVDDKEYTVVGENLIMADNPLNSPEILMDTWMNSEGHKANILFPDYTDITIGVYVKDNVTYAVQLFKG